MRCLLLVLLAAVMIVAWRGDSFFQWAAQTRAVQQAIAQETAKVEELRQQIEVDRTLTEEQRREMLDTLKETQQQLKKAQSLEQATAVLTQGEKQFESLTSSAAEAQAEALRQAGRKLSQAEGSALQAFGQNLAEGDFLTAAENLRNSDVSQLSSAEKAQLADQLDNMAEAVQASNPELAQQLRAAADAARNGDAAASAASIRASRASAEPDRATSGAIECGAQSHRADGSGPPAHDCCRAKRTRPDGARESIRRGRECAIRTG